MVRIVENWRSRFECHCEAWDEMMARLAEIRDKEQKKKGRAKWKRSGA